MSQDTQEILKGRDVTEAIKILISPQAEKDPACITMLLVRKIGESKLEQLRGMTLASVLSLITMADVIGLASQPRSE